MGSTIVNPTFRSDIDGRLFKNKDTNSDIQETLIFNSLTTRLSIFKGDDPLFPDLGLKQHLMKLAFVDEDEAAEIISEFESDIEQQMGRNCSITFDLDDTDKSIKLHIQLEGIEYPYEYEFTSINNSITVIDNPID